GTIEQWLVSVGDHVDEYDPLCEVITDKVTAEVPSTVSGTVTELTVSEGETVEINTVICKIDPPEENTSETTTNNDKPKASQSQSHNVKEETATKPQHTAQHQDENQPKNNGRFSPVVFKLASENQIDLSQVTGTGFEGRVTKKDILTYINSTDSHSTITNTSQSSVNTQPQVTTEANDSQQWNSEQSTIPVNGVRKAIANNMVTSATEIPHGWMMIEADATNLVKTR
ncbi:biotin/lipoyl-containing protein, partial [Staphylococcus aureus]